ncbi:MAG: glycosyltransferase [Acidimicrobiales bacterium]|jgi:glycosyltransferase involved in cell wall biosynthesis|nr:glycosyltransferase [Acidimicrobiales bacterium]
MSVGRGALLGAGALGAGFVAVTLAERVASDRRARFDSVRAHLENRRTRPAAAGSVRLSVVVPAYREEGIGRAVAELRSSLADEVADDGLEIVVVDDGSHDGTAELAEAAGADLVLRQPVNRGKGAAIRAGVLASQGRVVAFTDADLSYPPEQLLGLLGEVEAGWDVVVGSRRHTLTTTLVRARRLREVGGRAINLLTRAVLLGQYRDTQCGLKAFRSDVARLIFTHSHIDGFAFDVEVFHLVERYRLSLLEVPVVVENRHRSSVRVARDAVRLTRDLFRIRQWTRQGVYDLVAGETDLLDVPVGARR